MGWTVRTTIPEWRTIIQIRFLAVDQGHCLANLSQTRTVRFRSYPCHTVHSHHTARSQALTKRIVSNLPRDGHLTPSLRDTVISLIPRRPYYTPSVHWHVLLVLAGQPHNLTHHCCIWSLDPESRHIIHCFLIQHTSNYHCFFIISGISFSSPPHQTISSWS